MFAPVSRALVFGAYQLTVALGILLFPAAIVTKRLGIPVPLHRAIRTLAALHDKLDGKSA